MADNYVSDPVEVQRQLDEQEKRRKNYERERDVDRLAMMSAMIASGLANQPGTAKSIATRAIEIARTLLTQLREGK